VRCGAQKLAALHTMSVPSSIFVHEVQQGNPVLKYIRNVKWEFSADIVPDYAMGSTCALFLSVKFHFRHPTVS
jgi:DNA excision repair protein ERCC-1